MFIRMNRSQCGYDRDGAQKSGGAFLVVMTREDRSRGPIGVVTDPETDKPALCAIVRSVRMWQSGHFMFGYAKVGALPRNGGYDWEYKGRTGTTPGIHLSGTYGADGLPVEASQELWDLAVPVPRELALAFWSGGGHNSSGSEGPAMRAWALEHENELRAAGRKPRQTGGSR